MYKFTKKPDEDNRFDLTTIEVRVDSPVLDDILDAFTEFLAGCGFNIRHGEIVYESESERESYKKCAVETDEELNILREEVERLRAELGHTVDTKAVNASSDPSLLDTQVEVNTKGDNNA